MDAVRRFVSEHRLAGAAGAAAVSGGGDSVALLLALVDAGCRPTVAHVNHLLRGDASDADEAFARELAGRLGLPFAGVRIDVRALGGNLEAAARRARYGWLATLGVGWVATGHTADDQAETVLHRLIRGTGLQGLRGIAAVRSNVVRPMLSVTRAEILAYLHAHGQPFRTDATNADPALTRNRIRHELLPLLRTFNPGVVRALGRLAEQADETFAVVEADADALRAAAELPRAGATLVFDHATLLAARPQRVRDALRLVWHREGWPADGMSAARWKRLAALQPGDYPGRVRLTLAGRVVRLGPAS